MGFLILALIETTSLSTFNFRSNFWIRMDDLVFLGQEDTTILQIDAEILLFSGSFNGFGAFRFSSDIVDL